MSMMSFECRFAHIRRRHQYLMISLEQIQFGELACTLQFVKQFINCWDWKTIFNSDRVQCYVVHAEGPGSISFFDQ